MDYSQIASAPFSRGQLGGGILRLHAAPISANLMLIKEDRLNGGDDVLMLTDAGSSGRPQRASQQ